eukprot:TRINITY_DN11956_c0_g1_i1.p1 TRINITY_DN11956_c0_g1~~TRINITY_DN11956_c0_g1_i1.p1  ORF type:complete len:455 (-),score=85.07 TRINITY_DN11956_c0_g1_i1:67-1392(-)
MGIKITYIIEIIGVAIIISCSIISVMLYTNYTEAEMEHEIKMGLRDEQKKKLENAIFEKQATKYVHGHKNELLDKIDDNEFHVYNPKKIDFLPYIARPNDAYIFIIGRPNNMTLDNDWSASLITGNDWMGVIVGIKSLTETLTRVPNIVVLSKLHPDDEREEYRLPNKAFKALLELKAQIIFIDNPDFHDSRQPSKKLKAQEVNMDHYNLVQNTISNHDLMNLWSLTQYDRIVYLNPDALVVNNIDHLFELVDLDDKNTIHVPWHIPCNGKGQCSLSKDILPKQAKKSPYIIVMSPNITIWEEYQRKKEISDRTSFDVFCSTYNFNVKYLDNRYYGVPVTRCIDEYNPYHCYDPYTVRIYINYGCIMSWELRWTWWIDIFSLGRASHFWTTPIDFPFQFTGKNVYCYAAIFNIWKDLLVDAFYPSNEHPIEKFRSRFHYYN